MSRKQMTVSDSKIRTNGEIVYASGTVGGRFRLGARGPELVREPGPTCTTTAEQSRIREDLT